MKSSLIKLALIIAILLVVSIKLYLVLGGWGCHKRFPDYQTRYDWYAGCLVDINGKYIPDENVRGTE